nr:hypothetical protein [Tanacetum cinerariifolium]
MLVIKIFSERKRQENPTVTGDGPGGPRNIRGPPVDPASFFVFLWRRLYLESRKHLYLNPIKDSIFHSISGNRTGLATQVGYRTFFIIPALSHSSTSSLTTFLLSRVVLRFLWTLGWSVWLSLTITLSGGLLFSRASVALSFLSFSSGTIFTFGGRGSLASSILVPPQSFSTLGEFLFRLPWSQFLSPWEILSLNESTAPRLLIPFTSPENPTTGTIDSLNFAFVSGHRFLKKFSITFEELPHLHISSGPENPRAPRGLWESQPNDILAQRERYFARPFPASFAAEHSHRAYIMVRPHASALYISFLHTLLLRAVIFLLVEGLLPRLTLGSSRATKQARLFKRPDFPSLSSILGSFPVPPSEPFLDLLSLSRPDRLGCRVLRMAPMLR